MDTKTNQADGYHWSVGEIVDVPKKSSPVKKSGIKTYEHLINSHYICIRECVGSKRGVLVKVLGKTTSKNFVISGGEPFCKDDKDEGFKGDTYYGYRFPKVKELKEVLDIIRGNHGLLEIFEKASMHINPNSTFWVRDIAKRLLVLKEPQYYNAQTDELFISGNEDSAHYRITMAYFYKSQINW